MRKRVRDKVKIFHDYFTPETILVQPASYANVNSEVTMQDWEQKMKFECYP